MTEIPDAMTSANIPEPEVPVYLAKLYLGFWKDTGCMIKTDRDEDPVPVGLSFWSHNQNAHSLIIK